MRKQTRLLSLMDAVVAAFGVTTTSSSASEYAPLDCYSYFYGSGGGHGAE